MEGLVLAVSYDSACSYSVNIVKRFKKNFPELADRISDTIFTIDHLHLQNHIDKCTDRFSSVYMDGLAHFPAIANEQYWAESNQIGAQTRQMNGGHRQDKLTSHHDFWCGIKKGKLGEFHSHTCFSQLLMSNSARYTARGIILSRKQYTRNRNWFRKLCYVHRSRILVWRQMKCDYDVEQKREVKSLYRHSSTLKGKFSHLSDLLAHLLPALSLEIVQNRLMAESIEKRMGSKVTQSIFFLAEGISIEVEQ
jgi:hypothetical protein